MQDRVRTTPLPPRARQVTDSFGEIAVPAGALWGAQTARSLRYFSIGAQRMPIEVVRAIALIKWAAAGVNTDLGLLDAYQGAAIADAARRVAEGELDDQFPLSVWQTGSGTQTHMNVNEVIAELASDSMTRTTGADGAVDAHAHVNLGQSSNDVFPSAMHIAVALQTKARLRPALQDLRRALTAKAGQFESLVKIGRTHLQDATPLTLGQEISGWEAQLALCERALQLALDEVHALAIGGTAVGTGMGTHPDFATAVIGRLAQRLQLPLRPAANLFAALAGHEALVAFHAALRMLAVALLKIGNDVRLLGSGPRGGFGELRLPANEPGSSFMPGKVNPTQVEALAMVCAQVMGHDTTIGFAASQGQLELNVFKPLIALDVLDSVRLLSDAMRSFTWHCVSGLEARPERLHALVQGSLMLASALAPHIGHDAAARVAWAAENEGLTVREAALRLGVASAGQLDAWLDPQRMLGPQAPAAPAAPPEPPEPAAG